MGKEVLLKMAQWWIFVLLLLGVVITLWVYFSRAQGRSRITTSLVRTKSRMIESEFGLSFVWSVERSGEDKYTYLLKTDQEGMQPMVFAEDEIIDLNKHINVAGNQVYIARSLVAKLSDNIDLQKLESGFKTLKGDYEQLQAQHNLLRANKDAEIQAEVSRITEILKSVPRGGKSR